MPPSSIHPSTIHWNHSSALVKLANSDHLIGLHPNRAQGKICHFTAITCELWWTMSGFVFAGLNRSNIPADILVTILLVTRMSEYHEWIRFWAHELLLLCKFALLLTLLLMFSYLLTSIISRFSSIYTCSLTAKDHSKRQERKLLHRVQFCKEWTLTLAQKSEWITSP